MDKSVEKIEKLVEATNLALAQMKYSLLFSEWNQSSDSKFKQNVFLQCGLLRSDKEPDHKAIGKIKELMGDVEGLEQRGSKVTVTGKSKKEASSPSIGGSGITGKSRKGMVRDGESVEGADLPSGAGAGDRTKEELKSKIIETQEIVDRGFQTARELTEKISDLKKMEKIPSSGKTFLSEASPKLGKSNEIVQTDFSHAVGEAETQKSNKSKSCSTKSADESAPTDTEVETKKKRERPTKRTSGLVSLQLPGLHIWEDLQVRKVQHLDIAPEPADGQKENPLSSGDSIRCFYCGKSIKLQKNRVDPEEIDKILVNCNFNVFDPRIDEFVKMWSLGEAGCGVTKNEKRRTRGERSKGESRSSKSCANKAEEKIWPTRKRLKLHELSLQVSKKYRKSSLKLDDDRLRLDRFLRGLHEKINESEKYLACYREMEFSKCGDIPRMVGAPVSLRERHLEQEPGRGEEEKAENDEKLAKICCCRGPKQNGEETLKKNPQRVECKKTLPLPVSEAPEKEPVEKKIYNDRAKLTDREAEIVDRGPRTGSDRDEDGSVFVLKVGRKLKKKTGRSHETGSEETVDCPSAPSRREFFENETRSNGKFEKTINSTSEELQANGSKILTTEDSKPFAGGEAVAGNLESRHFAFSPGNSTPSPKNISREKQTGGERSVELSEADPFVRDWELMLRSTAKASLGAESPDPSAETGSDRGTRKETPSRSSGSAGPEERRGGRRRSGSPELCGAAEGWSRPRGSPVGVAERTNEDFSHSEGEISGSELLDSDRCSSQSLGEVFVDKTSTDSELREASPV